MIPAAFVVAAGIGTGLRFLANSALPRPIGTLLVNVVGSFLLGWLTAVGSSHPTLLGVAGLGALTTFSTVVAEVVELSRHQPRRAISYAGLSLILGVGAAWLGLTLG